MIRTSQEQDIVQIADIWLDTNLKAHSFIPAQYWTDNFEAVKGMFSQAELYIYEDERGIQGFVGLSGDYIAGIFVRSEAQSHGIGKKLIDYVKGLKKRLNLSVYQKNAQAVHFYQKEQFQILWEQMDEDTGEAEYRMGWEREQQESIKICS